MVIFTEIIGVKRERSSPNMIDNHRNGGTFTSVSLSFYDSSSSGGASLGFLEWIGLNIGYTNGNYLLNKLGCVLVWLIIFVKLSRLSLSFYDSSSGGSGFSKLIRLRNNYNYVVIYI